MPRLRILVVGGGVAGLVLASRLEQQGCAPIVVERSTTDEGGYALGLYPLGSCVLHGLGTYEALLDQGLVVDRYELADHRGRELQGLDMATLTGAVGPMVMLRRSTLIDLLAATCPDTDLRRGRTVVDLVQDDAGVDVALDDGSAERVDLVVACDGINSTTRDLVFGPPAVFDTGWVLHTWWADDAPFDPHTVREWWGRGWFFGAYPAPGTTMCAAGGPVGSWGDLDDPRRHLREQLAPLVGSSPAVDRAVDAAATTYRWPMADARSDRWVDGRVVLCGDAATAFLPTAGVGASNAMRAAAGLADELSRADASTVPLALELYEKRCRSTIEANQTESRRLARVMFLDRRGLGWLRDRVAQFLPGDRMLAQIIDSQRQPL